MWVWLGDDMVKKIIFVVLLLIGCPLIATLFTEDSYEVEWQVDIAKRKPEVFAYVKLLKNQDHLKGILEAQ